VLRLSLLVTVAAWALGAVAVRARAAETPAPADLAQLVDTLTATDGGGHTFPGAEVPFGMVQWSPDTRPKYTEGSGYDTTDDGLWGYSLTHLSGAGCAGAGDVPMLPLTGPLPTGNPNRLTTGFSHTGEVGQAGYYSARSNGLSTITSEFTATPHSAMARFSYPATTRADFLIKLMASQNGDFGDSVQVINNHEVQGSETSGNFCRELTNGSQQQLYTLYFDITFDRPFKASQVITQTGQTSPEAVNLTFDTSRDQLVRAKVGISYVSAADAKLNWHAENPGWNFDAIRGRAQSAWNHLLGKIDVAGGTSAQTQEFYSLLYKSFLQPNITSDVNGQFMGADLKVHTVAAGQRNQYGMFSGWDIYHSLSQLQAMLDPGPAGDMAQSQLNYYSEDALLQQWGYDHLNNYVMVGDPADAVIADIYTFGAHHFHTHQALSDMLAEADTVNYVRPGEAFEQQLGYLPEDGAYGCCHAHGFASALLEYDTADLALAQFAKDMGDSADAVRLTGRANNWENLFDPNSNLLTSRLADGLFEPGVTRTFDGVFPTDYEPYVEGDPYEYLWDVPNDYAALFSLLGGKQTVRALLEQYLSKPNAGGLHAYITNEFDFGEQFALDYAQDPAGTQKVVADIRNTLYRAGPDALSNNDDLGANSSTLIWEMLGMYPENAGRGTLVFASPGFPQATIHLANGHAITIHAPGASPTDYYVQSLRLNGHPYTNLSVDYSRLARGATLDWTLGTRPSRWGSAPGDAPPSYGFGLRPAVGFISRQRLVLPAGTSATVQAGAQNATRSRERVEIDVTPPANSGLSVTPARRVLSVPPNGRAGFRLRVSAPSTAVVGIDWITAKVLMSHGRTETVMLEAQVTAAPAG
jgi:predicted alpha-1,2-mannosidase